MSNENNIKDTKEISSSYPYPVWLRWAGRILSLFLLLTFLQVLFLKWINPPASSFMIQRQVQAWFQSDRSFVLKYDWAPYEQISNHLKLAAVASEDQRFADHAGFDLKSIEKVIEESRNGERLRGASTISQQVAKNLFLWPGGGFFRKGIEAWYTILIEQLWSKKRILEMYLNIAEFGDGVYGARAAAKTYFDTDADKLTMMQSALMVTVLPNPKRYDLHHPSRYMKQRRYWVLSYMHYYGNRNYLDRIEQ